MIIDASVAIRWVIAGDYQSQAAAILDISEPLRAPGHFMSEVANVLFKYVRDGLVSEKAALSAHDEVREILGPLVNVAELHDEAFELCLALLHPIYDCYYLALALRTGDVFVTADQRFLRKLAGTRFAPHAMHLSEVRA